MTRDELMKELDTLKDFTNDEGKRIIDRVKATIEQQEPKEESQQPLIFDAGRRHDARDPGETDQHKAEKLKLA